jgi:hypothetical protein
MGDVSVISPEMLPIDVAARTRPWMPSHTRPIIDGWYECRFPELEPRVLRLQWLGRGFYLRGNLVDSRTLLSWRGSWQ